MGVKGSKGAKQPHPLVQGPLPAHGHPTKAVAVDSKVKSKSTTKHKEESSKERQNDIKKAKEKLSKAVTAKMSKEKALPVHGHPAKAVAIANKVQSKKVKKGNEKGVKKVKSTGKIAQ